MALSEVLTAANVVAPIITVLRSISMSLYFHYDAEIDLRIIAAQATSDSYEAAASAERTQCAARFWQGAISSEVFVWKLAVVPPHLRTL